MKDDKKENNITKDGRETKKDNVNGKTGYKMSTPDALLAVIAVLVIMSGIQVFQTQKLLAAVQGGAVSASTQTQGSSVGLPSQVGGCG